MTDHNDLHEALRQLSKDIRVLIDLSMHESDEAWDKMVEIAKKEIANEIANGKGKSSGLVHHTLISEIYDHLGMLVRSLKNSQERLRRLATRDLLTGLYNRNFFNETIVRDIKKAERDQEKLSFIAIDIDKFKYINDTYGHLHGDGVLKACADLLKKCVRKSDFLCRYGGDEFIIVTPMHTCEANSPLFSRIEESIEEWNSEYSSFDYKLSLSMGCAVWEKGRDIIDVLHEADKKMYRHKKKKK